MGWCMGMCWSLANLKFQKSENLKTLNNMMLKVCKPQTPHKSTNDPKCLQTVNRKIIKSIGTLSILPISSKSTDPKILKDN